MKIRLKKKKNKYAQVHVNLLRDRTLSLRAKGLGAVLESYSDDFNVSLKSIEFNSLDGKKSVQSAIKELEKGYYLFRFQSRDDNGRFITYWAFDSEKLDTDYLKSIVMGLEKVELISPNDLNSPGYHKGDAVNESTASPFTGCGQTVDGQTVCGESTTYNNNIHNNKNNNNLSIKREGIFKSLNSFKSYFISNKKGVDFKSDTFTHLALDDNGLIINRANHKLLTKDEAYSTWNYLYNYYQQEAT